MTTSADPESPRATYSRYGAAVSARAAGSSTARGSTTAATTRKMVRTGLLIGPPSTDGREVQRQKGPGGHPTPSAGEMQRPALQPAREVADRSVRGRADHQERLVGRVPRPH